MSDILLAGDQFSTFEQQDKILVGVSGGVDSATCVHILQQQGFAVVGAVILFSPAHQNAVQQAQRAAAALGIEIVVIDAQKQFEQQVVTPFCESYCNGTTPNPCVVCNPKVKFRLLAQTADAMGIRLIATGHYARVVEAADGQYRIACAHSKNRDQSYMLYRLGQDILQRLCLPLGEFEKQTVREIAQGLALPCADAPDSMEICFIPDGDHAAFIQSRGKVAKQGNFLAPDGSVLAPHKGVSRYTLGQRKGLGIALGKPAFVKGILPNGDVQLGWAGQEFFSKITIGDICTPHGSPLAAGQYEVKIRSAALPIACRFDGVDTVVFDAPTRAPAPGQSAVFYVDDTVVGGGVILQSFF